MKTFLKIVGGVFAFLILIIIGLNIYFTDARLQRTVMPHVNEAVGRDVQIESMSLTLFSTFPQPGLSISKMSIPGETPEDTLMALDELVVGVELFSLFGDEISISEIKLNRPKFTYRIYPDSTSNIDFLLDPEAEEDTSAGGYAINIPYFEVINGQFGYVDETSATDIKFADLNANISLRYAELIESTVDIELGGLYATIDSTLYTNGLPLSLTESSTIDMEEEIVKLSSGTFSIRGLALNLSGTISDWSSTLAVDLNFDTSSDNFGELLRLVPAEYEEQIQELETRGLLAINGSLSGPVGGDELPSFNASIRVQDGYLKNPDLPQAIENIQISARATNELVTIENLSAKAGSNNITGSGSLANPLSENGVFNLDFKGNVDLATVSEFYDISQFDIEQMGGRLDVAATATGNRAKPEEAKFDANLKLANGTLKYREVPKAIDNITIDAKASQDLVTINNMNLNAAQNTFSAKGTIRKPLDENNRTLNLDTDLRFDLATIKEFYPINEDTLQMNGLLTAQATLQGKADQIEQSVKSGSINLKNGFVYYERIGQPLRDITLESVLEGPKLTIVNASFRSGENNLKVGGLINNYLSENRSIDLKIEGAAKLSQITTYYDLQPTITKLSGNANINLRARGQIDSPAEMAFDGTMQVKDMNMEGEGLVQPVSNLNGSLKLSPSVASLESLSFKFGSSDIELNGSLKDYMEYLHDEKDRKSTPHLTGSYYSKYVNVDEIIDWSDTTETNEPTLIVLPDLTSSITAKVDKMLVTGVNFQNLSARAETTPKQIKMNKVSVNLFEGTATGSFIWDIPKPDRTKITFNGSLEDVRGETFFKEYQILGPKSDFHNYISGAFSSNIEYYAELDEYLTPVIETTRMDGNFGMTRSRLKNHPMQLRIASLLNARELESVSLDEWKSTFDINNSIMTINNLRLTSSDVGVELNGTHHLINENINYDLKLFLPQRFKKAIASVISEQAANALQQENGTIAVPFNVSGTADDPKLRPDQDAIKPIIQQFLKNKAGNALKKLFGDG